MNHASAATVDDDARRYLKHHATLEASRERAYLYLNQVWLQLHRLLNRELVGDLRAENWIEVISTSEDQISGLRWRSTSLEGGVVLEIADVRRWTHVSGDQVVFTISSSSPKTRHLLTERCRDEWIERLFHKVYQRCATLKFGPESSRVISVAVPLSLVDPRSEAQRVIEGIVALWELIEGGSPQDNIERIEAPPSLPLQSEPSSEVPSYERSPRYVSAAPLPARPQGGSSGSYSSEIHNAPTSPPFPPTMEPLGIEPVDQSNETGEKEERSPLEGMSKEEMIQAIQAQVRQRPGRLIRGGEKKSAPVLAEPPRFVPRTLERHEERAANQVHRAPEQSQGIEAYESGKIYDADVAQHAERLDLGAASVGLDHDHDRSFAQMTSKSSQTVDARQSRDIDQPSYIKSLELSGAQFDERAVIIKGEATQPLGPQVDSQFSVVTPKDSYYEEADLDEEIAPIAAGELENEGPIEASELDAKMLSSVLGRIGLSPWRVNSYDEGRGQILWLNNGAHIDYNPSGDVILGGENQEETRARLSQMGVLI